MTETILSSILSLVGTPSKSGYTYLKVYVNGDYGRIARRI